MSHANGTLSHRAADLRERIGWICHGLRIAAVAWIAWIIVMVLVTWSNKPAVLEAHGRLLAMDLSGVSDATYAIACAIVAADVAVVVLIVFCIWQLFATYLAGRVFTSDAALWLRHTGSVIIAAIVVDVVFRVLIASIFAGKLVLFGAHGPLVFPQDLLHLIFALFVLALAHIFKAAAEMADDHAQIV